jgi:hypothetical protein
MKGRGEAQRMKIEGEERSKIITTYVEVLQKGD